MAREQFTFYRSFWEAIRSLKRKDDRLAALEAICAYALDGEERDMTDVAAGMFILIKPVLDSAEKKSNGGKTKGSKAEDTGKTKGSKAEDTGKEKEGEDEKEGEIEVEVEKENECSSFLEEDARAHSASLTFFLDRLNPAPSSSVIGELMAFREKLGEEVTLHALHIAVDERKTAWSYIRAILRRYENEGLTDLAAVLASETKHEEQKRAASIPSRPYGNSDALRDDTKTMDQVRRLREKMNGVAAT